jgi:hypothetical protein
VIVAMIVAATTGVEVREHASDPATICTDTVAGKIHSLVVPQGATCTATDLVVAGAVKVERDATLHIAGVPLCDVAERGRFLAGGPVAVAPGGSLLVQATDLVIGGNIVARKARAVGVVKTPCEGARGVVRGNVIVEGTNAVGILGLRIDESVFVFGSGDEGLEVGTSAIGGTLLLQNNHVIGAESPSIFAVHFNTIERGLVIVGNDATGAFVPPLVGANTISRGNLVCVANVPAPTNVDVDVVLSNTVLNGLKIGQCAGL